ncbi:ATP synthase F1 subunit gamma [TM7 phylum sp. oral taxon 350]|jgi:ATP synthase F1, gamma subunit|nr:ATP synthase F1 subunit gamma [TM7 phylum sp. oral taxon 350]
MPASTRQLKTRVRSVKSTRQITKAMQLVAASKMRRSQKSAIITNPYTDVAKQILGYLYRLNQTNDHILFREREVKKRLIIVISSDKGLAGAYNTNILKEYMNQLNEDKKNGIDTETIAVGRKAASFITKLKNIEVVGVYEGASDDVPSQKERISIIQPAIDRFKSGEIDAVDVLYTKFESPIKQQVLVERLLPAGQELFIETKDDVSTNDLLSAKFEPSVDFVIDNIAERLLIAWLQHALLDAKASEHSMRMLAMKNATDNANDLIDDLTLAMNKARQGSITQELTEISSGVEALNN